MERKQPAVTISCNTLVAYASEGTCTRLRSDATQNHVMSYLMKVHLNHSTRCLEEPVIVRVYTDFQALNSEQEPPLTRLCDKFQWN